MVVSSIMSYDSVVYESYTLGAYTFPHWASVVGWSIAASSMVAVPVTAVYQLITLPAINYRQVSPRPRLHRLLIVKAALTRLPSVGFRS